jgi:hypothetical protein
LKAIHYVVLLMNSEDQKNGNWIWNTRNS